MPECPSPHNKFLCIGIGLGLPFDFAECSYNDLTMQSMCYAACHFVLSLINVRSLSFEPPYPKWCTAFRID